MPKKSAGKQADTTPETEEQTEPKIRRVKVSRPDKGTIEITESELERYQKSGWKLAKQ